MKEVDYIAEAIEIECTIRCSKCRNTQTNVQTDEYYFSDELMEYGWRATKHHVYCPDCAKKYIKSPLKVK